MKAEIKIQRALEKARKHLEAIGVSLDVNVDSYEVEDEKVREAEGTLAYYYTGGHGFKERECSRCSRRFASNHPSVGYCSNSCRINSLADIGIEWSPTKTPEERWAGPPPLIVPPDALALVTESLELTKQMQT